MVSETSHPPASGRPPPAVGPDSLGGLAQAPLPAPVPAPLPVPPWYDGLRSLPGEARSALRILAVLAAAGVPAGLLWLLLAPRREYQVVDGGFRALEPQSEALIGADGWLMTIIGVLGILAAGYVWWRVAHRGAAIVSALAGGMLAAAVVAWQVGELLGTGASPAEQSQIGAVVIPRLDLRAIPVLVIGAFLATLTYLVAVSFAPLPDLRHGAAPRISSGWTESPAGQGGPGPHAGRQAPSVPGATGVTESPAGSPSDPRPGVPDGPRQ